MEEDDFSLCVLDNARKAARAVSRHYDRLARQVGMTAGQFSVLVAIRQTRQETTGELASRLSMERTTLVRNIALLERKGFVTAGPLREGRGKTYLLTERGARLLEEALPLWRKAQGDVRELLGTEDFYKTIDTLKRLSEL
ncbi:MarR family winged helix-turn-helix transcriptional regulator [Roseibium sp.]|uniref:MarR family winged helix-turn-helix transcriptional regulator n=1 Tax=Roseibium sp. TaxID=1936156 RepID=UPI003BB1FB7E